MKHHTRKVLAADGTLTDEGIAQGFTSAEVKQHLADFDLGETLSITTERVDLEGTGTKDYLVALYTSDLDSDLAVIRLAPAPTLAARAGLMGIAGRSGLLQIIDLDGDGKPEVVAHFSGNHGDTGSWMFAWHGGQLVSMTPTIREDDEVYSDIVGPTFVDLDGDGLLEAIGKPDEPSVADVGEPNENLTRCIVYRLSKGAYARSGELDFAGTVYASAETENFTFDVPDPSLSYGITVVNGDNAGKDLVESAKITLNGKVVLSPADFGGSRWISRSVTARRSNTLTVQFDTPAHGQLFVGIGPASPIVVEAVVPILNCVWDEGGGIFTASFGYDNPNSTQTGPLRTDVNAFSPGLANQYQPRWFLQGRHDNAFWVRSDVEALTWTLNGKSVVATTRSTPCRGKSPGSPVYWYSPKPE